MEVLSQLVLCLCAASAAQQLPCLRTCDGDVSATLAQRHHSCVAKARHLDSQRLAEHILHAAWTLVLQQLAQAPAGAERRVWEGGELAALMAQLLKWTSLML